MTPAITGISSMATRQLLADLVADYQRAGGGRVAIESVGGVDAARRVKAGEAFDFVILASNAIEQLIAAERVVAGSAVGIVLSGVAVAVRAGDARPDVGSEAALRRAVQATRSLSCSTGPSGVHLAGLFERWGIAAEVAGKFVQAPPGVPVGSLVARGEVELGFQQLSELIHLPGIDVIGPLPPEVQIITTFTGGLIAGSEHAEAVMSFFDFINSEASAAVKRRHGMEPA